MSDDLAALLAMKAERVLMERVLESANQSLIAFTTYDISDVVAACERSKVPTDWTSPYGNAEDVLREVQAALAAHRTRERDALAGKEIKP